MIKTWNQYIIRFFREYHEEFDGFLDTRPYGPMAVGLDFSFPKASYMYGLPMHLETLTLQSSKYIHNFLYSPQHAHDAVRMFIHG